MKWIAKAALAAFGYEIRRRPIVPSGIPDESFYLPHFSPWLGYRDFDKYFALAKPHSLVSPASCYILLSLAKQAAHLAGCWLECGVYKGGTSAMLVACLKDSTSPATLHLFDTFSGMPTTDSAFDWHKQGDFCDTDLDAVRKRVNGEGRAVFHPGLIPNTFRDAGVGEIALAHIDVDIFQSVIDCCEFIYPRMVGGGFMIFDDYGLATCPGARKAVDKFFAARSEVPVVLPTGQALIIKL